MEVHFSNSGLFINAIQFEWWKLIFFFVGLAQLVFASFNPIKSYVKLQYLSTIQNSKKIEKYEHEALKYLPNNLYSDLDKFARFSFRLKNNPNQYYYAYLNNFPAVWADKNGDLDPLSDLSINLLLSSGLLHKDVVDLSNLVGHAGGGVISFLQTEFLLVPKLWLPEAERTKLFYSYKVPVLKAMPTINKLLSEVNPEKKLSNELIKKYFMHVFNGTYDIQAINK